MCDHCKTPREIKMQDLTDYGEKLMMILQKSLNTDQRLTGKKTSALWEGGGLDISVMKFRLRSG